MGGACGLLSFDLLSCMGGALFGWVAMIPWWGWGLIMLAAAGLAYRFASWPGLIAFVASVAFFFGRRSAADDELFPDPDPKPTRAPRPRKPLFPSARRQPPGKRRFDPDTNTWVDR